MIVTMNIRAGINGLAYEGMQLNNTMKTNEHVQNEAREMLPRQGLCNKRYKIDIKCPT